MPKIHDCGWEVECRGALSQVPAIYCKSGNSTLPDNDSYGTYRGMSWRCESKFTESDRLEFSRLTTNELTVLHANHLAGGLSFVAIAQDVALGDRRAWCILYADMLVMGLGNKPGSVVLEGPDRCPFLFPIPLLPADWGRKGSLPEWWFEPWFKAQFSFYLLREFSRGMAVSA